VEGAWLGTFYEEIVTCLNQMQNFALYEGESNENRKNFFKFNLLNESGAQLYHFST
jgi:ABC-type uncharacterized transport system fused permease/ATPase subunit